MSDPFGDEHQPALSEDTRGASEKLAVEAATSDHYPALEDRSESVSTRRTTHRQRSARLVGTSLMIAVALGWMFFFRPQTLGGSAAFVGVDGVSMTPTMNSGDLAVVERKVSYHVGDIIAYRIPAGRPGAGDNVIHRIVGGNGTTGFITKGDHNPRSDYFWHPTQSDVIGRVWFHIPDGATWLTKLRHPLPLGLLVTVVTFALVAWPSGRKRRADDSASSAGEGRGGDGRGAVGSLATS